MKKQRYYFPVFCTLFLTAVACVMSRTHMCHLESPIIELLILVLVVTLSCVWTYRAATRKGAFLRVLISFFIAIGIQFTYLTWLHSNLFPKFLLSEYAREREAFFEELNIRLEREMAEQKQRETRSAEEGEQNGDISNR